MGLFDNLKKKSLKTESSIIDRKKIPSETIDAMQKIEASEKYNKFE